MAEYSYRALDNQGGARTGVIDAETEAHAIRDGGGFGSIVGRNSFQRDKGAALSLLDAMVRIYQGEAKSP